MSRGVNFGHGAISLSSLMLIWILILILIWRQSLIPNWERRQLEGAVLETRLANGAGDSANGLYLKKNF